MQCHGRVHITPITGSHLTISCRYYANLITVVISKRPRRDLSLVSLGIYRTHYVQDVVQSSLSHCLMSSYSFLLKQLEPEDLPESAALNNTLSPGAGNPWRTAPEITWKSGEWKNVPRLKSFKNQYSVSGKVVRTQNMFSKKKKEDLQRFKLTTWKQHSNTNRITPNWQAEMISPSHDNTCLPWLHLFFLYFLTGSWLIVWNSGA